MSTLSNGLAVSRSEPHQKGSLSDRINAISISQFRCLHFSNELASTLSDRLHSYEPHCYRVQLNYFMKFIEFDSLMHRVSSTSEFRIPKNHEASHSSVSADGSVSELRIPLDSQTMPK